MGYRKVNVRHNDALANMPWDEFERLMTRHYAARGYRVEHSGTGAKRSWRGFDGGIDLKLYRGDEYIVVQCKRHTQRQVTHNVVHELIGVMQTQGATGGIVVNSGEFSAFALESAAKYPHIQLIDGIELRRMLAATGDLPGESASDDILASMAGAHRGNDGRRRSRRASRRPSAAVSVAWFFLVIAAGLFVYHVYITQVLDTMSASIIEHSSRGETTRRLASATPPTPASNGHTMAPSSPGTVGSPPPKSALTKLSKKESEEWDRKNAESMRILEKTTPTLE